MRVAGAGSRRAAAGTQRPAVSVVVPARNAERQLPDLLAALEAQTLPEGDFEVVIADDASGDATAEVAARAGAAVVRSARRGGSYAARNRALDAARGAAIAFTDADCRPAPEWLERGLAGLRREDVELVSGQVAMPLGEEPGIPELLSACTDIHQEAFAWGGFGATANLFVERRVLGRIGRFNDALVSAGDLELCLRARAAGFRIWYCADAVVEHSPRRSARAVARKAFRTGYGQAQVVRGGTGPAAAAGMYRTRIADLVPRPSAEPWGAERLREIGYRPARRELARVSVASKVIGAWPRLAGYAAGALRGRVGGG